MKIHTTNQFNAFVEIAEDCPATQGEVPPIKGSEKTAANLQFDIISENPYRYTSDDVLFECFAIKKNIAENDREAAREQFFSKGQPCFRASPLTKRYGWGVHHNQEGKIALYGCETTEYQNFTKDKKLTVVKAMRSKKT